MDQERLKKSTTTDGRPAAPGFEDAPAPQPINPISGQHEAYWVLSAEERAKGFVRPVRDTYVHVKCGTQTHMGRALAETYARDPNYYGATFCVACRSHFQLITSDGAQFFWIDEHGNRAEALGS
jgi:hypothetical protein